MEMGEIEVTNNEAEKRFEVVFDDGSVAMIKYIRAGKNQYIGFNYPDEDVVIEGDARQLRDVVDHLIRNATSYTPVGGWVEVTLTENPASIDLFIVDNGVGIAEDEIERVFERMYRGRSADAGETDTRGLGLGLYISREIVHAHHGTIRLHSQLQTGTMVVVTLPINLPVQTQPV